MNLYPENYAVDIEVLFTDLNGTPITPTAVKAVLYDGDETELVDFGSLPFVLADGKKIIQVPASFNVLGAGELSAARILRAELVTTNGTIKKSTSYIVQGEVRLAQLVNSFQSLEAAEIVARDMPNLVGWSGADENTRIAALIEAYNRLTRIPVRYSNESQADAGVFQRIVTETVVLPVDWADMTEDEFLAIPASLRKALRQAQVAEANEIVQGDVISQKIRSGIVSETIGESSMTLKGGRIDLGVSSTSLKYLTGFIYYNLRIARA